MSEFDKWWSNQIRFGQIHFGSAEYWDARGIAQKAFEAGMATAGDRQMTLAERYGTIEVK